MDLDGDGNSTWGDRYVFNYWLELGGQLTDALAAARVEDSVLNMTEFFHGPGAALSPEAGLLGGAGPKVSAALETGGGVTPLQNCTPNAVLQPPFKEPGANQVYVVYCDKDDLLLSSPRGHALLDSKIYVAADVCPSPAEPYWPGISRFSGFDNSGNGTVPLPDGAGSIFFRTDEMSWTSFSELSCDSTRSPKHLLGTATWKDSAGYSYSGAIRFYNLENSNQRCQEFRFRLDQQPWQVDGLALLEPAGSNFGQRGTYFVSTLWSQGNLAWIFHDQDVGTDCPQAPVVSRYWNGSDLMGIAFGDFDPLGQVYPFALYVAVNLPMPPPWEPYWCFIKELVPGPNPRWLRIRRTFFHFYEQYPLLSLAFDPYSNTLFAANRDTIYRINATGVSALFLTNLLDHGGGMSFTRSGLLVVSERGQQGHGQLVAVDGWRYRFKRGDANKDGVVNISDANYILNWLFLGMEEPTCWDAADVNDDAALDVADPIYLLLYLNAAGPPPPPPYSDQLNEGFGADPSPDLLGCRKYLANKEILWP